MCSVLCSLHPATPLFGTQPYASTGCQRCTCLVLHRVVDVASTDGPASKEQDTPSPRTPDAGQDSEGGDSKKGDGKKGGPKDGPKGGLRVKPGSIVAT